MVNKIKDRINLALLNDLIYCPWNRKWWIQWQISMWRNAQIFRINQIKWKAISANRRYQTLAGYTNKFIHKQTIFESYLEIKIEATFWIFIRTYWVKI
jgi:hypothetical protein